MAATYTKPTFVVRWADTGTIVEPLEARKDSGWLFEDIPPASQENWFKNGVGQWVKWVDERLFDGTDENEFVIKDPDVKNEMLTLAGRGVNKEAATSITTDFVADNVVVASGATFQTNVVALDDVVTISGSTSNDGTYLIEEVTSEIAIKVRNVDGTAVVFTAETAAGTVAVDGGSLYSVIAQGMELSRAKGENAVGIFTPPSLASAYNLTLLASLPASTSFLTVSAAGQLATQGLGATSSNVVTITDGVTSTGGDYEGTDHTPFVNALAALSSGGVIIVSPGTYTFTSDVTITADNTHIVGQGRLSAEIAGTHQLIISANDCTIKNIKYTSSDTLEINETVATGNQVLENILITECEITNMDMNFGDDAGCRNVIISNNHFTDVGSIGGGPGIDITLVPGAGDSTLVKSVTIIGNTFHATGTATAAISFNLTGTGTGIASVNNCSIVGNTLDGATSAFLQVLVSADVGGSCSFVNCAFVGNAGAHIYGTGPIRFEKVGAGGTELLQQNILLGNLLGAQAWSRVGGILATDNRPDRADGGTTTFVSSTSPGFTAQQVGDATWNS